MQRSQIFILRRFSILLGFALMLLVTPGLQAAARERVLYRFSGGSDGAFPSSNLVMDASGNFYGTASHGGNTSDCTGTVPGCGVVFDLNVRQWQVAGKCVVCLPGRRGWA